MTEFTQESPLKWEEIECNLIDDNDDEYDNNIVCISNKVIIRMRNNDGVDEEKLNQNRNESGRKEKYNRKVEMKKKIANMIMNATKEYPSSEEDVKRDNETTGILKMINWQQLTKKKRVPNQWPDYPTKHSTKTLSEDRSKHPRG